MAKNIKLAPNEAVQIVVSTYWPTKIIKEVTIKDLRKDSFRDEITLGAAETKYLFSQLKVLFNESDSTEIAK